MLKYYLGIFGGHGPNPAAAILCNNKLIAFGEEERFVRIKNATSMLPINSILCSRFDNFFRELRKLKELFFRMKFTA